MMRPLRSRVRQLVHQRGGPTSKSAVRFWRARMYSASESVGCMGRDLAGLAASGLSTNHGLLWWADQQIELVPDRIRIDGVAGYDFACLIDPPAPEQVVSLPRVVA